MDPYNLLWIGPLVLIFLGALIFGTLWIYIMLKRKGISKHLEFWFILIFFCIVIFVHFVCAAVIASFSNSTNEEPPKLPIDFWTLVNQGFREIFSLIGGLTFEGQNFEFYRQTSIEELIFSIIYFCTIAWLAITNGIIIVLGFSYTIYSEIIILFLKKKIFFERFANKQIYIFLYATKESLILANNIKEDFEKTKKEEKKNNKLHIIFASDELEPFDKTNEIHNEIAQRNYLYIPFPKKDFKRRKSIVQNLFGKHLIKKIKNNYIKVFALKTDKYGEGFEAKNNDIVFDDIKLLLTNLKKEAAEEIDGYKTRKNGEITFDEFTHRCENQKTENEKCQYLNIDYYLLSNNDPNFEFYEYRLKDIFCKVFDNKNDNDKIKNSNKNVPLFNLTILNEAIMSAEDLIDQRNKNSQNDHFLSTDDKWINYLRDGYKTLVIGFGQNGQKALEHVYINSNGGKLEPDTGIFVPTRFFAEVIDSDMDNIIGSYILTHPAFVFNKGEINTKIKTHDKCFKKLVERYGKKDHIEEFENIRKYIAFPEIFYESQNFNDIAFLDKIEKIINRKYNSIIIALGNDEENIKCANSIIQSIRQSVGLKDNDTTKKLKIFININDHNNEHRIQWYENDKIKLENIFVYKFGMLNEIYSTKIFENEDAINVYKLYKQIGDGIGNVDDEIKNWEYDYLKNSTMYEKKTNESVSKFRDVYKAYLKAKKLKIYGTEKECYKLIQKDYDDYVKIINNPEYVKTFWNDKFTENNGIPFGNQFEVKCFTNYKDSDNEEVIQAFKERWITIESNEKHHIKANFVNYKRLIGYKSDLTYEIWRYLAQFEHSRWCRHIMAYGRTYTKDYEPSIAPTERAKSKQENEKRKNKNKNYWKNNLKLHCCLIPYSNDPKYDPIQNNNFKKPNYLEYYYEDFDYGCVIVALDFVNKNKVPEKGNKEKEKKCKKKRKNMLTSATQKETKHL